MKEQQYEPTMSLAQVCKAAREKLVKNPFTRQMRRSGLLPGRYANTLFVGLFVPAFTSPNL